MKKLLIFMATVIAVLSFSVVCFAEDTEIKVMVAEEEIVFDQGPVLVEEKPMLPMRAIFEKLGAFVNWDNETKTATAIKGNSVVMIQIDNEKMFNGSEAIELEIPAILLNDRTLIPVHAVQLSMNCDVVWDSEAGTVTITEKAEEVSEEIKEEEDIKETEAE